MLDSPGRPSYVMKELLRVDDIRKSFVMRGFSGKERVQAVRGVSFTLGQAETLGLVGESGCGKSTTGRLVLGLLQPDAGTVMFNGHNIHRLPSRQLRLLRREIGMVSQDSTGSLNPRMTLLDLLEEPFRVQHLLGKDERRQRAAELADEVGLGRSALGKYPHEFSGGQRQRIAIARALALKPKLIVADEPASALDVSVQAQILNLMRDLQQHYSIAYLFISHDLPVVEFMSHRIAVMYLGNIVEIASRDQIYGAPKHPYTRALLDAIPQVSSGRKGNPLRGEIPSPTSPPEGCAFHTRCPQAMEVCRRESPPLTVLGDHVVTCHLVSTQATGNASWSVSSSAVSEREGA